LASCSHQQQELELSSWSMAMAGHTQKRFEGKDGEQGVEEDVEASG